MEPDAAGGCIMCKFDYVAVDGECNCQDKSKIGQKLKTY